MAHSGVKVDDQCIDEYNQMKLDKSRQRRCIIYKISDDKSKIEIEKVIYKNLEKDQKTEYEDIIRDLPDSEGRYIVWDMKVPAKSCGDSETVFRDDLVFMAKCFDDCKVTVKMLHASSEDALRRKLEGVSARLDCKDSGDMCYDHMICKCKHKK